MKKEVNFLKTFIAVDIGASSGRLMKSQLVDGKMTLEEVHRFKNGFRKVDGHERWDIQALIKELLTGLEKVKKSGIKECFLGIDTWAVDYCLVDKNGDWLADPIAYRDSRTDQAINEFQKKMSLETLYAKTGIQLQPFNTIFQLFVENREMLATVDKILLIPDFLGYVLTGKMVTEKTNASTTQLLNVATETWDDELLDLIGVSKEKFAPLVEAGSILGQLQSDKFTNYDLPQTTVVTVATHDTASAVIGAPGEGEDWSYISSGTWSLLGTEERQANASKVAFQENYTNEWGANHTIRFLKNIMGMWLIQEVARQQEYEYSYAKLADMANQSPSFQQFIDVNDSSFLNPENMITAIQNYCKETKQIVPETPAELARCIYDNLALCYATELEKLQELTHKKIDVLHIVGGGSNNKFLNQLTANVANIKIIAGPSEATAIGNVVMQMVASQTVSSISQARHVIGRSFSCGTYKPQENTSDVLTAYKKFLREQTKKQ